MKLNKRQNVLIQIFSNEKNISTLNRKTRPIKLKIGKVYGHDKK